MSDRHSIKEILDTNLSLGWAGEWDAYLDGQVEAVLDLVKYVRSVREETWDAAMREVERYSDVDITEHLENNPWRSDE